MKPKAKAFILKATAEKNPLLINLEKAEELRKILRKIKRINDLGDYQ